MSTPTPTRPASAAEGARSVPGHLTRVGTTPTLREYIADLWAHRDFLVAVPLGELRAQNQNTVFGNAWHLLNPLLLALVYYLIFGVILGAGRGVAYFVPFLIIGIMTYQYVNKVMQSGARAITSNLTLIQSIRFPRASLPLASAISESIAHIPALVVMMVLVVLTSPLANDPVTGAELPVLWPTWSWLLLIPGMVLLALFAFGLSLLTARTAFHFRDMQQLLPYVLRLWMYLSAMVYPVSLVEERAGDHQWIVTVFKLNPLYEFFTLFREALIGPAVGGPFSPLMWLGAGLWAVSLTVVGVVYFRAHEAEYSRA